MASKVYNVYFEDYPSMPMRCTADNKTEARKIGAIYNRQWELHSKIIRIEEVVEQGDMAQIFDVEKGEYNMSREFGIYPEGAEPKMWWGARAIITEKRVDIPYDRQNFDGDRADTDDFMFWINNTVIPTLNEKIKKHDTQNISFNSEGGRFHCEAADRKSGGYLYIGCWTNKE